MTTQRSMLSVLVAAAMALPAASFANTVWHALDNEAGGEFHPEHQASSRTRAEVVQEFKDARQDGSLRQTQRNASILHGSGTSSSEPSGQESRQRAEDARQLERDLYVGG